MQFVTSRQVRELRDAEPPAALLDVRTPEDFAIDHLAGALHACVFEVSFVDQVRRLVPELDRVLVVYGPGTPSLESTEAARKLAAAGYSAVVNFPGGLAEWKADGFATLGNGPGVEPPAPEGWVPIDLNETRVEWTGRNLLNRHCGTVAPKSGRLGFERGWLVGGEVVLDMTSIRCTDISDPVANAQLIAHLASADFFDIGRHPEARLEIRQAAPVANGRPGVPNLELRCDFTLRGITRPLAFPAVAGRTPEGRIAAQAVFAFDRTEWGSAYGSGRFFRGLGKHLVNDLVEVQVRMVA
jgi:rhodanese-related sulfurtransferase